MEKLSSLNEKRREQLAPLKESTAYSKNKATLDKIGEDENGLTFNGKPVGGVEKRPTAEITLEMWSEQAEQKVLLGADEIDLDPALVGKEIADVEFVTYNGIVSIKDMAEKDLIPYISMLNHFTASDIDGVPVTLFAGVYYPSTRGWLYIQLTSYAITSIKITYYTD